MYHKSVLVRSFGVGGHQIWELLKLSAGFVIFICILICIVSDMQESKADWGRCGFESTVFDKEQRKGQKRRCGRASALQALQCAFVTFDCTGRMRYANKIMNESPAGRRGLFARTGKRRGGLAARRFARAENLLFWTSAVLSQRVTDLFDSSIMGKYGAFIADAAFRVGQATQARSDLSC